MSNIKPGDRVVCLPGFINDSYEGDPKYGGAGYINSYEFTVHRISEGGNGHVFWEKGARTGVFEYAVKLLSDEPNYEIY